MVIKNVYNYSTIKHHDQFQLFIIQQIYLHPYFPFGRLFL